MFFAAEFCKIPMFMEHDISRCVAERKYTQEQARKEFQQVFIPECNDDGTYSQAQCHVYTGYCWCVTPNGRPISGTAVAHKTPRCPGSLNEKLPQREGTGKAGQLLAGLAATSTLQGIFCPCYIPSWAGKSWGQIVGPMTCSPTVHDHCPFGQRLWQHRGAKRGIKAPGNSAATALASAGWLQALVTTDGASAPALETQPQGDEEDIASRYPTLWTEQVKSRQNKTNKNYGGNKPANGHCAFYAAVPTFVVLPAQVTLVNYQPKC
uniref:Uncharacterized protein n=1 Tax=Sphaerodactylus townsendi TaxID=933632 RepID=A0ACB8GCU7_9SAUR